MERITVRGGNVPKITLEVPEELSEQLASVGDIVRANVPKGKHQGVHLGRVSVRESGAFDVTTPLGKLQSIRHKHCQPIHRKDGYSYSFQPMSTIVQ
ncbi:hypothetical protein SAMD00079811_33010 [Scytonema sp. HK-05]|uniref:hypothetical protein n=1 Tax=Scytonema sp. HK-05 TaxID=1137095 RepID=UPI00093650DE|nr:hypothetical protein [Scytonema sp. HK-05]OKH45579.1 hypothetical protein NIES2130_37015 [Scytonema sp. HK-05]BAY45694.1 hypothetical protein SAMD00079811_33010 [Scytonema sp. HK-05]